MEERAKPRFLEIILSALCTYSQYISTLISLPDPLFNDLKSKAGNTEYLFLMCFAAPTHPMRYLI